MPYLEDSVRPDVASLIRRQLKTSPNRRFLRQMGLFALPRRGSRRLDELLERLDRVESRRTERNAADKD